MAVFQKVPPEILRHILELGAEDEKGLGGRDLCSTALVARTWSQPAQELLVYKFWSSRQPNAPEYIDSTFPSRSVRAITLSTPTPRHNSAAKAHRLIERHGTRLEEVVIGSQVPSAEIAFILAHGTPFILRWLLISI